MRQMWVGVTLYLCFVGSAGRILGEACRWMTRPCCCSAGGSFRWGWALRGQYLCVTTTSKTCCSDRTPRCAIPNTHAGPGARVSLRVFARAQSTHTGPPGCKPCGSSSARRVPSHAWTQEQAEHPFPRCNTCPCASTRCWVAADGASQPPSPLLPRPRPGCRRATFTASCGEGPISQEDDF